MADETLITFLLHSTQIVRSLELLGSWDNFAVAYPMAKDTQKGHGHYYGCHHFKDMICHGDPSSCSAPADGGLKIGGTYWYYYKRDGDVEFHDSTQPSTSMCPMLPGQTVNILEIPNLAASAFVSSESTSHLTMDLQLRWKSPQAPRTQHQPTTNASIPMSGARRWWFSQSLARLQTAVVDHVIGDRSIASAQGGSLRRHQQPPARATTVAGPCVGSQSFTNTPSRRVIRNSSASSSSILNRTPQSRYAATRRADSVLLNHETGPFDSESYRPVTWPGARSRSHTENPNSDLNLNRRLASAYADSPSRNAEYAVSDHQLSAAQETRRLPDAKEDSDQALCQHPGARTNSYLQIPASYPQFELTGTQLREKPGLSNPAGSARTLHPSGTIFNAARSLWTPRHSPHSRDQTVARKALNLPKLGATTPVAPISPRKTPCWSFPCSMLAAPDEGISLLMTSSSPPLLHRSYTPLCSGSSRQPPSPSIAVHCAAPSAQVSAGLVHDMKSPSNRGQLPVLAMFTAPPPQAASITLSTSATVPPIDPRQDSLPQPNQDAAFVPVGVCSKDRILDENLQAQTNVSSNFGSLASRRLLRKLNSNHVKIAGSLSIPQAARVSS